MNLPSLNVSISFESFGGHLLDFPDYITDKIHFKLRKWIGVNACDGFSVEKKSCEEIVDIYTHML